MGVQPDTWIIGLIQPIWTVRRILDFASIGYRTIGVVRKLIDIGFCLASLDIENLYGWLPLDIGRSEVANPRQSTSETKIDVNNYVNKSTIARFHLYGFYV
jgi:hypothetical protein